MRVIILILLAALTVSADTFTVPASFSGDATCPLDAWIQTNYARLHTWGSNTLIFPPGLFYTRGIKQGYNWNVQGSGESSTTIKLADDAAPSVGCEVIGMDAGPPKSPNYFHTRYFYARDLTLDCNFGAQSRLGCPSAVSGLYVSCQFKIGIERITVTNAGSIGREGFPILARARSQADIPDQIFISECKVPNFTGLDRNGQNGYCTAIAVVTRERYWELAGATNAPYGRATRAALVQSNVIGRVTSPVTWLDGIGMGATSSDGVEFSNNLIEHCEVGFGFDTGRNYNISILNNRAVVNSGAKIGSPNSACSFEHYLIRSNVFELTAPIPKGQVSFGIGLAGHASNIEIIGNTFRHNTPWTQCHGVYSCMAPSPIAAPYNAGENTNITVLYNTFTPKSRFANYLSKKGVLKVYGNNKAPELMDR